MQASDNDLPVAQNSGEQNFSGEESSSAPVGNLAPDFEEKNKVNSAAASTLTACL